MKAVKSPEIGAKFGQLTVLSGPFTVVRGGGKPTVRSVDCLCDCGNRGPFALARLLKGRVRSCGCLQNNRRKRGATNHGESRSKVYYVWLAMRDRCQNPNNKRFKGYGARGIAVCPEWDADFFAFREWALANGYTEGLTVERVDNGGNYEPGNCRWATLKEQANNTRRNRYVTAFGETKLMREWDEDPRCVVNRITLHSRLKTGWDTETAMTLPPYSVYRKAT